MNITPRSAAPLVALLLGLVASLTASAQQHSAERVSPQRQAEAYRVLNDAIAFLRAQQDAQSGGWAVRPDGVTFPAITALVVDGMLQHPAIDATRKNVETRHDQWTTTDGITSAARSRDFDMTSGDLVQTGIVLQSKYNLPDDELDLPRTYVPSEAPDTKR